MKLEVIEAPTLVDELIARRNARRAGDDAEDQRIDRRIAKAKAAKAPET